MNVLFAKKKRVDVRGPPCSFRRQIHIKVYFSTYLGKPSFPALWAFISLAEFRPPPCLKKWCVQIFTFDLRKQHTPHGAQHMRLVLLGLCRLVMLSCYDSNWQTFMTIKHIQQKSSLNPFKKNGWFILMHQKIHLNLPIEKGYTPWN